MVSITADTTNLFINSANLVVSQDINFAENVTIGQEGTTIAIGNQAGKLQSAHTIAIGNQAATSGQQDGAIAIGTTAGYDNQGDGAIAIGYGAGDVSQGISAIAIGVSAGSESQGDYSIAIGSGSGGLGTQSIALGRLANTHHSNTIVINATGTELNSLAPDSMYVFPIRHAQSSNVLTWNSGTGEVTSAPSLTLSGDVTANAFLGSGSLLHNLTGVTPGTTWGSQNQIPVISIDGTGKVSGISNVLVSVTSDRISNLVSAVGELTANTIYGNVTTDQVTGLATYSTLQSVTGVGNTTSIQLQFNGGFVTSSNVGISNTSPLYPFVVGNNALTVGSNGNIGVNSPPNSAQVTIVNSSGTQTALAVSGNSVLQTWTNGSVVASVSNIGGVSLAGPLSRRGISQTVNGTYTVVPTDSWILANTAAAVTLTLPDPTTCPGRELMIRRLQTADITNHVLSSNNNVFKMEYNVNPAVAQNIILNNTHHNNANPPNLPCIYWCTLVSDGTYWWQMSGM